MDFNLTVVANEAQLPEPIHEEIDSGPRCAHHLCYRFLTDFGKRNFVLFVLAEVGKQEENAGKPLVAGIKKLVNQVLFVSDARVNKYATNISQNACSRWVVKPGQDRDFSIIRFVSLPYRSKSGFKRSRVCSSLRWHVKSANLACARWNSSAEIIGGNACSQTAHWCSGNRLDGP